MITIVIVVLSTVFFRASLFVRVSDPPPPGGRGGPANPLPPPSPAHKQKGLKRSLSPFGFIITVGAWGQRRASCSAPWTATPSRTPSSPGSRNGSPRPGNLPFQRRHQSHWSKRRPPPLPTPPHLQFDLVCGGAFLNRIFLLCMDLFRCF